MAGGRWSRAGEGVRKRRRRGEKVHEKDNLWLRHTVLGEGQDDLVLLPHMQHQLWIDVECV